ncbi:cytochrome C biogenesis protein CcdA [Clostridium tetani]|uniref:Cytochrome c-type biogenesis protein ccdA n=1 Tax=Clostridium tetani (strain Massachusetts / E88) TaxID=212717 RepID=Q899M7_CLOTE|nr:cytochrome c biogenesis protein CcdA [Clostridium tetani]AAO34797.1 cytochrome c-type biogenesis protein ccdA [Clostridium tetani E88]AVP55694.1 cytochrome c biogenesis protein CcdA [Clostridium tetani]KGI36490.1 cytochrome C biogenesis protein DsbD [Clostridium tetani]KGI38830.1 cytochrome C biogenesis protein DsbD [Clostridium tetani ATCC 9441]KGI42570.1 cytochrome C biogenesis protein DsbD [Clostridium tetani]
MGNVSLFLAFSSGLLSFLSPCVLPLVPIYLTYLTGSSIEEMNNKNKLTVIYKALGFTLGFTLIFIIMGISVTSLGQLFDRNKDIFRKIGGIIIIVFGLHIMGVLKIKTFYYQRTMLQPQKFKSGLSSFFIGMAFAIGWTPCVGPMLASILIYAGSTTTLVSGIKLLIAYSVGLGIPFIISGFLVDFISGYIKRFSKYFNIVSIASGLVLIFMGIMTFTNKMYIINNIFN